MRSRRAQRQSDMRRVEGTRKESADMCDWKVLSRFLESVWSLRLAYLGSWHLPFRNQNTSPTWGRKIPGIDWLGLFRYVDFEFQWWYHPLSPHFFLQNSALFTDGLSGCCLELALGRGRDWKTPLIQLFDRLYPNKWAFFVTELEHVRYISIDFSEMKRITFRANPPTTCYRVTALRSPLNDVKTLPTQPNRLKSALPPHQSPSRRISPYGLCPFRESLPYPLLRRKFEL